MCQGFYVIAGLDFSSMIVTEMYWKSQCVYAIKRSTVMMALIVYLGSCRMCLQHCLFVSCESIDQNGQIVLLLLFLQTIGRQVLVLFHHHELEVLEVARSFSH